MLILNAKTKFNSVYLYKWNIVKFNPKKISVLTLKRDWRYFNFRNMHFIRHHYVKNFVMFVPNYQDRKKIVWLIWNHFLPYIVTFIPVLYAFLILDRNDMARTIKNFKNYIHHIISTNNTRESGHVL